MNQWLRVKSRPTGIVRPITLNAIKLSQSRVMARITHHQGKEHGDETWGLNPPQIKRGGLGLGLETPNTRIQGRAGRQCGLRFITFHE